MAKIRSGRTGDFGARRRKRRPRRAVVCDARSKRDRRVARVSRGTSVGVYGAPGRLDRDVRRPRGGDRVSRCPRPFVIPGALLFCPVCRSLAPERGAPPRCHDYIWRWPSGKSRNLRCSPVLVVDAAGNGDVMVFWPYGEDARQAMPPPAAWSALSWPHRRDGGGGANRLRGHRPVAGLAPTVPPIRRRAIVVGHIGPDGRKQPLVPCDKDHVVVADQIDTRFVFPAQRPLSDAICPSFG